MTKQAVDAIYYNGERLFPISISGVGLPHPSDFGLHPSMISTGNYRGFYCEYTLRDAYLWLSYLLVRNIDENYPKIGEVKALYKEERFLAGDEEEPEFVPGRMVFEEIADDNETVLRELHYQGGIYPNLNVPAPFTGGILFGIGDVDVPPIQYDLDYLISSKTILELMFNDGQLIETIDHSGVVAAKRDEVMSLQLPKHRVAKFDAACEEWIHSTLTLNYKFLDISWLREIYARPRDEA